MKYDVVLMVVPDKLLLLKISMPYIIKNLGVEKIYLVANKECENDIKDSFYNYRNVYYINEDELYDGLSFNKIKEILIELCGDSKRTGWFFQQFLKMVYACHCKNEYYLIFDSDTVPLNTISYFDDNGRPFFITKREYFKPYFDTINVLFDGAVKRVDDKISFIAENMIISKEIMQEIINRISSNDLLEGNSFYEKILKSIDRNVIMNTGFSEFETYGNYVMTFYPDMYGLKKLRTQRLGSFLFGITPNTFQLNWAAEDYDIISFEMHGRRWLQKITKSEKVVKCTSAKKLFNKFIKISNFLDRINGFPVVKIDD